MDPHVTDTLSPPLQRLSSSRTLVLLEKCNAMDYPCKKADDVHSIWQVSVYIYPSPSGCGLRRRISSWGASSSEIDGHDDLSRCLHAMHAHAPSIRIPRISATTLNMLCCYAMIWPDMHAGSRACIDTNVCLSYFSYTCISIAHASSMHETKIWLVESCLAFSLCVFGLFPFVFVKGIK
jgi:hypothetical protein